MASQILDRNPVLISFFCLSKKIRKLQNDIRTGRGKDSNSFYEFISLNIFFNPFFTEEKYFLNIAL